MGTRRETPVEPPRHPLPPIRTRGGSTPANPAWKAKKGRRVSDNGDGGVRSRTGKGPPVLARPPPVRDPAARRPRRRGHRPPPPCGRSSGGGGTLEIVD